jgi:glycosyltransferase involved in cell wall biosynthesis
MKPNRILHVVASVDPALGGVAESIRARGVQLKAMGHTVEVVSLDEPADPALENYELTLHPLGKGWGGWNYHPELIRWLRENCKRYDAIIVDGIWQFHVLAVRLALKNMGVPYYVFTHGMLDPWFKTTYPLKHLKKWLFWPWCEYLTLKGARAVLFTCEEEKNLASQSFWLYKANAMVVPFGTTPPPDNEAVLRAAFFARHRQLAGKPLMMHLGRIHEKKGGDILIEAFGQVAKSYPEIQLAMVGPGEEALITKLKHRTRELGIADRVHWLGMLKGEDKWSALYASDLFVLPSHQENFGIAVVEALACGKPVAISKKVNIWREVQKGGGGIAKDDSVDGAKQMLTEYLSMSESQIRTMSSKARLTYAQYFSIEAMATGMVDLITSVQSRAD